MSETRKNIFASLLLQFVTIISGFIIPRVILDLFGSEVNGLVNSINQFLNYIQLIEGGLGGVVMAALYAPLRNHDSEKVSGIINATSSFFKTIGAVYIIYLSILAFVYPLLVDTGFNYLYSVALIVVLGINLIIQYFFSITFKLLLNADRKVYIVSFTQSIIIILNVILVLICASLYKDVLVIKMISAILFIVQPFIFSRYVSRHYNINRAVKADKQALEQRWVAFGTNFAYFVHTNTDIIILTVFSSLANVSIYSVYMLVVNALKSLISSISSAIVPSFGRAIAGNDRNELLDTFSKYEFIIHFISLVIFTCGAILIVPFVMLYTKGVYDANYNQPVLAILLVLAEFFYCVRDPYVQATSAAGMFRKIAPYAYIEAGINIFISILLVRKYGIIGVAAGTIAAMLFRMIAQIIIVNKEIIQKSSYASIIKMASLSIILFFTYFLATYFGPENINSYGAWFGYAIIIFVIVLLIAIISSFFLYRDAFKRITKGILNRKNNVNKNI